MSEFWRGTEWVRALKDRRFSWQIHAIIRMSERGIPRADVLVTLLKGDCIESYPEGSPFPSVLFLGYAGGRPLHVVASFDSNINWVYIITAYEPDLIHFEAGFRKRRTL